MKLSAHPLIAVAVQAAVGLATGNWLLGGALMVGVYLGREHAQAEQRWIERYAKWRRAGLPWWGGFDARVWNTKSLSDWLLPLVACVGVYLV